MKTDRTIMLLAGEASGDKRAAELMQALRRLFPEVQFTFFGSGGDEMRAEGAEILADVRDTAIIGPVEIVRALGRLRSIYNELLHAACERQPDAVILIDWPEFNLRIVKDLKKAGLTTIYYISPQLWAWRRYRVRTVRRYVDKMIVILPFEVAFYRRHGIAVEFVGHPLVDSVRATLDRQAFCEKFGLAPEWPIVSLLPGSRRTEVEYILPVMIKAAHLIRQKLTAQFIVPLAPTIEFGFAHRVIEQTMREVRGQKPEAKILNSGSWLLFSECETRALFVHGETYNALAHSDLAVVTSGTATLESALLGTPLIVVYRGRPINYWLVRPLIKLSTFGMVNLIAGERIAPELIQRDLTPDKLAAVVCDFLMDGEKREALKKKLGKVREQLGGGNAAERAAQVVMQQIS